MKHRLPVIEAHEFADRDFVGGDAALDFVNTVTGRDELPRDWLDSYERMLDWAAQVQLLPPKILRILRQRARNEPAAAASALARAKALREALFTLLAAIVSGSVPPKGVLTLLREYWMAGINAYELRFKDARVVLELGDDAADFDLIAAIIAYRTVEQVLRLSTDRLRMCHGPNCSWVFFDTSKAGRRRWCDMTVCGNAAKSRRFHKRSLR